VAALSKNTKKTTTPSKVVTRTNLDGWFARTLTASTCTLTLKAILCTMLSINRMNSSMPRELSTSTTDSDSDARLLTPEVIHFESLSTARRNVVTATTTVTSMATSSSSPICASLAALRNSPATVNEIETDRSAPRCDSASEATPLIRQVPGTFRVPLAPNPFSWEVSYVVQVRCLDRVCRTSEHLFNCPLLCRLNRDAKLVVYSCFLAPNGGERPERSERYAPYRRGHSAAASPVVCNGSVFGVLLCSLTSFLLHAKASKAFVLRLIAAALREPSQTAKSIRGFDRVFLCAGMSIESVALREQLVRMSTAERQAIPRKYGRSEIVIGLTASIYAIFSVLQNDLSGNVRRTTFLKDIEWMVVKQAIEERLSRADEILEKSIPAPSSDECERIEGEAVDAEQRAVQRALCGVRMATSFAQSNGLTLQDTFRLQLQWFARAAWPAGEMLNVKTHESVLQKMTDQSFFLQAPMLQTEQTVTERFTPLWALNSMSGPVGSESDASSARSSLYSSAAGSAGTIGADMLASLDALVLPPEVEATVARLA